MPIRGASKAREARRLYRLLAEGMEGEVFVDKAMRYLYATDSSVYQSIPRAVCYPKTEADIRHIIEVCGRLGLAITPRGAGTSLAGQTTGDGVIVDMSAYWNKILALDEAARTVWVQPGVIRDVLNEYLRPYGLFFGPNTSTSNRCVIGGMVGNNSCGSSSIKYGTTRDWVRVVRGFLSDGSPVEFGPLSEEELAQKCKLDNLEGQIYRDICSILSDEGIQEEIQRSYPPPQLHRRNTGYALDVLLQMHPFTEGGPPFNLAKLVCGSEGTLMLVTEIQLELSLLPPQEVALLALHFEDLASTMEAVPFLMEFRPYALEMMDHHILKCTEGIPRYAKLREWVLGDPFAILLMELRENSPQALDTLFKAVLDRCRKASIGYEIVVLQGKEVQAAWELRKAGLGLLGNMPGDHKAVACIEDTAVPIDQLKDYILDLDRLLHSFGQDPVYYAHAGAGELHVRPVLNLKDPDEVKRFRQITEQTAHLVARYRGSLSGEHGDGRVRSPFIPIVLGQNLYQLFCRIKDTWDPKGIFNPHKIVRPLPMDRDLRTTPGVPTPNIRTVMRFDDEGGIVRAIEKCNGSGDCRRQSPHGVLMCPTYLATREEYQSTRARANLARIVMYEYHTLGVKDLKDILSHCISCKGCKSECPSTVDIAALRAEVFARYYRWRIRPIADYFFGFAYRTFALGSRFRKWSNALLCAPKSRWLRRILRIHPQRSIPLFHDKPFVIAQQRFVPTYPNQHCIYLLADEFTRYHEPDLLRKCITLCNRWGYEVRIAPVRDSARSQISKGFLRAARRVAIDNVRRLSDKIGPETPLIGLEPSAILGFRDEYPRLVPRHLREDAQRIAAAAKTFDEWLASEIESKHVFLRTTHGKTPVRISVHTHCHQKALGDSNATVRILQTLRGVEVEQIPSGCCGMAGSFGYRDDHYEMSMNIGKLVLFPHIHSLPPSTILCANGVSCRHQIRDGTGRQAYHLVEILYELTRQ